MTITRACTGICSVRIEVQEGPQWFVDKLDLEGVPESDLPYLRSVLQSTEGEPFSEANVAADRDTHSELLLQQRLSRCDVRLDASARAVASIA